MGSKVIDKWAFTLRLLAFCAALAAIGIACSDSGSGNPAASLDAGTNAPDAGTDASDTSDAGTDASVGDGGHDGPIGSGESKAATIGPQGGSISLSTGATIEIPEGALSDDELIRFTETTEPPPEGFTTYSPVYEFEPEGLVFNKPVTIKFPFEGDPKVATLFWSKPAEQKTTGWDWRGGTVSGSMLTAEVTHFSGGFVADGVNYDDPPDESCVVTRLVEGREANPSGVALFFTVDDCWGRPITGLGCDSYPNDCDFVLKENGAPLSVEAQATILPRTGVELFASLALDVSSSTQAVLPQLVAGAKAFVNELLVEKQLPVHIGIELFAGEQQLRTWQRHTLDAATLMAKLDELTSYEPEVSNSTNLYGAVVQGLERLAQEEAAFRERNAGGAFTAGYLVLFTDGGDTASWASKAQALEAIANSPDQVIAVGLQSPDYEPATLEELAPNAVITAPTQANLENAFGALATRMAGQLMRTYLLGYCSPKMEGTHTITVEVEGSTHQTTASYEFTASGNASCSLQVFTNACENKECGGLGCGACDDRTSVCDRDTSQCVSFCEGPTWCEGGSCTELPKRCSEVFTNPNGYSQTCTETPPARTTCDGQCVDVQSDVNHCGTCGSSCASLEGCAGGACACCDGQCVNLATDAANCGACGRSCGGAACSSGRCDSMTLASGQYAPSDIAVDADFVYWTNSGSSGAVMKVSKNGGTPITLASGQDKPAGIAVDGDFVYWTSSGAGTVMKVSKNGGTPITVASGQDGPGDIAVDGDFVYWLSGGAVMKVSKNGGTPTTLASGQEKPWGIAVDGDYVYWTNFHSVTVMKVSKSGGTPTTLASGELNPTGIAVDADFVYWATYMHGVTKVSKNGGTPVTLASEQFRPFGIAVDADLVYWTNSGPSGAVMKVGKNGGTAVTLASEQGDPNNIAVDADFVYWTNMDYGTVMKAEK